MRIDSTVMMVVVVLFTFNGQCGVGKQIQQGAALRLIVVVFILVLVMVLVAFMLMLVVFALMLMVVVFVLLALSGRRFGAWFLVFALWSIAVNAFGAVTFGRFPEFYYIDLTQRVLFQPD